MYLSPVADKPDAKTSKSNFALSAFSEALDILCRACVRNLNGLLMIQAYSSRFWPVQCSECCFKLPNWSYMWKCPRYSQPTAAVKSLYVFNDEII
jgi:hypothetical protein